MITDNSECIILICHSLLHSMFYPLHYSRRHHHHSLLDLLAWSIAQEGRWRRLVPRSYEFRFPSYTVNWEHLQASAPATMMWMWVNNITVTWCLPRFRHLPFLLKFISLSSLARTFFFCVFYPNTEWATDMLGVGGNWGHRGILNSSMALETVQVYMNAL